MADDPRLLDIIGGVSEIVESGDTRQFSGMFREDPDVLQAQANAPKHMQDQLEATKTQKNLALDTEVIRAMSKLNQDVGGKIPGFEEALDNMAARQRRGLQVPQIGGPNEIRNPRPGDVGLFRREIATAESQGTDIATMGIGQLITGKRPNEPVTSGGRTLTNAAQLAGAEVPFGIASKLTRGIKGSGPFTQKVANVARASAIGGLTGFSLPGSLPERAVGGALGGTVGLGLGAGTQLGKSLFDVFKVPFIKATMSRVSRKVAPKIARKQQQLADRRLAVRSKQSQQSAELGFKASQEVPERIAKREEQISGQFRKGFNKIQDKVKAQDAAKIYKRTRQEIGGNPRLGTGDNARLKSIERRLKRLGKKKKTVEFSKEDIQSLVKEIDESDLSPHTKAIFKDQADQFFQERGSDLASIFKLKRSVGPKFGAARAAEPVAKRTGPIASGNKVSQSDIEALKKLESTSKTVPKGKRGFTEQAETVRLKRGAERDAIARDTKLQRRRKANLNKLMGKLDAQTDVPEAIKRLLIDASIVGGAAFAPFAIMKLLRGGGENIEGGQP